MMIVYHGSNQEVSTPDCVHSRRSVDFGPGFYVTPIYDQAKDWTKKFKRTGDTAVVTYYELADDAFEKYEVLRFDAYDEEWLDYIFLCRNEKDPAEHDMIMGGVANDRVYDTINLYIENLISKNEALERLKYHEPSYQMCIKNQEVLDRYLRFVRSENV